MPDMDAVRNLLETRHDRVYRRSRFDYRKPVGSEGWEFDVYVLSDTASEDAMLGSGVYLSHRVNFDVLVEEFESNGWPWFVTAQSFSVPVGAPDDALLELASAVDALDSYPVLDDEAYLNMEHELILEFIDDETGRLAHEFDVEYDDIYEVVKYEVFDLYQMDGDSVYVEGGLLNEAVEEYLNIQNEEVL